jgi:hypothetical protein
MLRKINSVLPVLSLPQLSLPYSYLVCMFDHSNHIFLHYSFLWSCELIFQSAHIYIFVFYVKSKGGRRPRSDDVDAVTRLSVLDNPYYRDLLCEFGAMFAIANRIDTVHKLPWIGFQSWRASGRKVLISPSFDELWSYWWIVGSC